MKKLIFIFLVFLLTGCYNYRELNNLAIVKGASVDIEDGQYVVTYIISNISKSQENMTTILEGKGSTISDAIAEMNLMSSKELYIGHMLIYVISEEVAKNGISNITDFFFRNPTSKKTFQIIISKNKKAKDILKVLSPLDSFPTDSIVKNLTTESSLSSFFVNTTLLSFLKKVKDPGIEAIASGITIIKNSKSENLIKIEPLAIFKNDIFLKWENEEISNGISLLLNQSSYSKITTNCEHGKVVFSMSNIKIKKSFKIKKEIDFKIKLTGNTEISEMSCNYNTQKKEDLIFLENILINKLSDILNKTIDEIKTTKIDSIGLGNYIYQNDYQNWLKIKNDYLNNLNVEFEIIPNLLAYENSNEGTNKINDEKN